MKKKILRIFKKIRAKVSFLRLHSFTYLRIPYNYINSRIVHTGLGVSIWLPIYFAVIIFLATERTIKLSVIAKKIPADFDVRQAVGLCKLTVFEFFILSEIL